MGVFRFVKACAAITLAGGATAVAPAAAAPSSLWFAVPEGRTAPSKTHAVLTDTLTRKTYKSNFTDSQTATETMFVGGWKVQAAGTACTMEKRLDGPQDVLIGLIVLKGGSSSMVLESRRWRFAGKSRQTASLSLDPIEGSEPDFKADVYAWEVNDKGILSFDLRPHFVTKFATSKKMQLAVEGATGPETYDINGAGAALDELRKCLIK